MVLPIRGKTYWNCIHLFPGIWCCFGELRDGQEEKEGFFFENGGRILEELVTSFNGKYNPFRIFYERELSAATNNYHSGGILHKGFTYILYKGTHEDRHITVKKFTASPAQDYIEWYVNEVAVASKMSSHKNVLKLLGCCLETQIPTLVYEFAGNGDLSYHIFGNGPLMAWEVRLKIAAEVANTVSYVHMSTPRRIIHREIRSRNIFLGQDYAAKLFEFGLSVSIPPGETHVDANVVGSGGFIAPESHATGRYTQE